MQNTLGDLKFLTKNANNYAVEILMNPCKIAHSMRSIFSVKSNFSKYYDIYPYFVPDTFLGKIK